MARKSHGEEWWSTAPPHIIRCTAHYKTGDRCRREANPGANVCGQHGALVPAVQARAAVRIQMNADEAAAQLVAWMNDETVDIRERIKIAHDMLDRSGLNATQKHVIGIGPVDPVEDLFQRLLSEPGALVERAPLEVASADSELAAHAEVVDAEVVESPMSAKPPKHIREALKKLI